MSFRTLKKSEMQSRRIPVDSGWHVSDTDFGLTRVLNRPVTVNRLRTFAPHICFSPRFRLKMRHLLMGNLKKTKRIPPEKRYARIRHVFCHTPLSTCCDSCSPPRLDLMVSVLDDSETEPLDAQPAPRRRRSSSKIKHCRQCFRDDYHSPLKVNFPTLVILVFCTLGLYLVLRPSSCKTCGTKRIL